MKVYDAEVRGTHPHSFRSGEWGRVIGIALVAPENTANVLRGCYVIRYSDGAVDYMPFSDKGNPCEMRIYQP